MRLKLAILDMNAGVANQGMRCIKEIANQYIDQIDWQVFDVRAKAEVPDTSFDMYISSGGPGHPLEGDGHWDRKYYALIDALWNHNRLGHFPKKHAFFICHSYQMVCNHLQIAEVSQRSKRSFGALPVYMNDAGMQDPLLGKLADPFYVVDVRDYQVTTPNQERLEALGASFLAIEQPREVPGKPRALMAVRFSPEWIGTQFHPEADPEGMSRYYQLPEKRKETIDTYGEAAYEKIIAHLNDDDKIKLTHDTLLPGFLEGAIRKLSRIHA